jgi:hypothetical protein
MKTWRIVSGVCWRWCRWPSTRRRGKGRRRLWMRTNEILGPVKSVKEIRKFWSLYKCLKIHLTFHTINATRVYKIFKWNLFWGLFNNRWPLPFPYTVHTNKCFHSFLNQIISTVYLDGLLLQFYFYSFTSTVLLLQFLLSQFYFYSFYFRSFTSTVFTFAVLLSQLP